jgi:hypothetical protein
MPTQNNDEKVAIVLSLEGFHRVLQDLTTCGNSEIVVNAAATSPTIVMASMKGFSGAGRVFTFPLRG